MNKVILKISGEALKEGNNNVSEEKLQIVLNIIKLLQKRQKLIGIVIGGGNFFRGREHPLMDEVTRDTIGMLGTVMNALYLKDYLLQYHIDSVVSTPFDFPGLIKKYDNNELNDAMFQGKVIIFGGGVGKSGYSTDSGVILARDILYADTIIKLTNVDGIYESDPKTNLNAIKYDKLTYKEVLDKDLKVMDRYAFEKLMEKKTKLLVMNFEKYDDLNKYFDGLQVGTIIEE